MEALSEAFSVPFYTVRNGRQFKVYMARAPGYRATEFTEQAEVALKLLGVEYRVYHFNTDSHINFQIDVWTGYVPEDHFAGLFREMFPVEQERIDAAVNAVQTGMRIEIAVVFDKSHRYS